MPFVRVSCDRSPLTVGKRQEEGEEEREGELLKELFVRITSNLLEKLVEETFDRQRETREILAFEN